MSETLHAGTDSAQKTSTATDRMQTSIDPLQRIEAQLKHNPVLLYMKGSPQMPRCGFSAKLVQILNRLKVHYAYVDVLENPDIRAALPGYAQWPTFPQLYIQSTLIGGCDIVSNLFEAQTLEPQLAAVGAIQDQVHTQLALEA